MRITIIATIAALALFGCGKKKDVVSSVKYSDALVEGSGKTCPNFSGTYVCEDLETNETSDMHITYYAYQDNKISIEIDGSEYFTDGKIYDNSASEDDRDKYVVDCTSNTVEILKAQKTGSALRVSLFRDIAYPLAMTYESIDKEGKINEDQNQQFGCEFK